MKMIIFLAGFILSANLYAKSWKDHFFTDDSAFYLKIHKTGFEQRFRVDADKCFDIESAEILLKSNPWDSHHKFKRLTSSDLKKWPKLYKENTRNFCWFGVKVNKINLNDPKNNLYSIKIKEKNTGKTWYFEDLNGSILPKNRFTDRPVNNWLSLGAHGATPVFGGGVLFKIWESEVDEVHLFLEDDNSPIVMEIDRKGEKKSHVAYVDWAKEGTKYQYKFKMNGAYVLQEVANNDRMSDIKVDPMARSLVYDAKGGQHNGYINPKAVVRGLDTINWKHDSKISGMNKLDVDNWLMYQIWPLTFNPKKKNGKYVQGTFNDVAEKIPYLNDLGVTAVEFLPVHESRFYASWGYAMDSLYLIENTLGSPTDLMRLVDQMHEKNIRVVLDVVLNHVNNQLIRDPLSETVSQSKYYDGNTGWGPKPRFESVMVRKWIMDSLLALVREFHVDGFRFDMVEYIYLDNAKGYQFLQELNVLLKEVNPDFYTSAEQLPDNAWVTYPISEGGLEFDSQWNDKFKNFFELEFDYYREHNRSLDTGPLLGSLKGFSNHRHDSGEHHFGGANRTLNYLGSHDVVGNKNPILRMVSPYESYEWEGSNHFFRVRPLTDPENRDYKFRLIHNHFTHSVGRTGYGILFTKPGGALFFQGEEMANDLNIENEWSYINAKEGNTIPTTNVDIHRYVSSHRVPWEYLTPETSKELSFLSADEKRMFKGYHQFFKKMIHFKKKFPEINLADANNVNSLEGGQVITYEIGRGRNEFFVVINLGEAKTAQWIQFPGHANDWWQETMNSSSYEHGGQSDKYLNIISNLGGRANHVRLEATSISVYKKGVNGSIARDLFLRGNLNNWQALSDFKLDMSSDRGDIYVVNFKVPAAGEYEFKLGTADWAIEMGQSTSNFFDPLHEILEENKGYLSYKPALPNMKAKLQKGTYKFIFNIRNYKYNFLKL